MTLDWPGPADRTRSYRGSPTGQFEVADVAWELTGASGIRTTPGELVLWADTYRTGVIGTELVTQPHRGAVKGAFENSDYGLGIMITPDGVFGTGA